MKFTTSFALAALLAQQASAHYIWHTLITGSTTSTNAIRQPVNNSPVTSATSPNIVCNINTGNAPATVSVAAGSTVGFILDNTVYHEGPAAIYLGKVPSGKTAATWDGSGAAWFKIAEWGGVYGAGTFGFSDFNASQLTTKIPASVPSGDYLLRIEQIGLHVTGSPQWYISCAQITVTGGGSANPAKVSFPGAYSATDPELLLSIYYPIPTSYTVPGPPVFSG